MSVEYKVRLVNALPVNLELHTFYYVSEGSNKYTVHIVGSTLTNIRSHATNEFIEMQAVGDTRLQPLNSDVLLDTSLGDFTVQLPSATSHVTIRLYYTNGVNNVHIKPIDQDVIVGKSSFIMNGVYDTIQLKGFGSKWFIL